MIALWDYASPNDYFEVRGYEDEDGTLTTWWRVGIGAFEIKAEMLEDFRAALDDIIEVMENGLAEE